MFHWQDVTDAEKLRAEDPACDWFEIQEWSRIQGLLPPGLSRIRYYVGHLRGCLREFVSRLLGSFFLETPRQYGFLFSKGRVLYEKPRSEFEKDMYVAQTYAVPAKEFLFLGPLLKEDLEYIEEQRRQAESTHRYNPTTRLFELLKKP